MPQNLPESAYEKETSDSRESRGGGALAAQFMLHCARSSVFRAAGALEVSEAARGGGWRLTKRALSSAIKCVQAMPTAIFLHNIEVHESEIIRDPEF